MLAKFFFYVFLYNRKVVIKMNNTINSNINFNGTFVIKKASPVIKREVMPLLGTKCHVFNNIPCEGDMLYVVRDSKDADVAKYIADNSLDFMYYPELAIADFNKDKPHLAKNKITYTRTKVISRWNEMLKLLNLNSKKFKLNEFKKVSEIMDKQEIKNYLEVDKSECMPKLHHGVVTVKHGKKNLLKVSPENEQGKTYIYVFPKYESGSPSRYSMDKDGNLFKYNDKNSRIFMQNFNDAIAYFCNNRVTV